MFNDTGLIGDGGRSPPVNMVLSVFIKLSTNNTSQIEFYARNALPSNALCQDPE
jgi:hypothetical protein